MVPRISVVMLSFHRADNISRIAEQQCEYPLVDEFIVFNSNPKVKLEPSHPKMHVMNASYDFTLRSRWCAATFARNEVLCFQDDDLIVSESGYRKLISHLIQEPQRMHGIEGRAADARNCYSTRSRYGDVPILLTHCVLFHRELIVHVLECETLFFNTFGWLPRHNGEDIFLSFCAMNLYGQMNLATNISVERLPARNSISRRPNHVATRTKVMRCCQELFGPAPASSAS